MHTCVSVVSGYWLKCSSTMDSPSSHNIISHHIKGMTILCSYKNCVLGLIIVWILCTLHYNIQWTLIDRLDHVYRDIVYTVSLCDVLVESHTAELLLLLDYYCSRIEVVFWEGEGTEVLKRKFCLIFWRGIGGGGGVALGRKTIHFFLWPWLAKIAERSALAFKSYRPENFTAEEKKDLFVVVDKTIRHSGGESLIMRCKWMCLDCTRSYCDCIISHHKEEMPLY